jgi:hypothetical protein
MHTRSFWQLLLTAVFVVSLIVVDRTAQAHLIAPPVDSLPRFDFFSR